jgi:hypothetical protein
MNLASLVRSAAKMDHSAHARCVVLLSVKNAELRERSSASTARKQDVRFVKSIWHHERATIVVYLCARTMDQRSTKPRFVRTVGRVTNDWETCSNWNG